MNSLPVLAAIVSALLFPSVLWQDDAVSLPQHDVKLPVVNNNTNNITKLETQKCKYTPLVLDLPFAQIVHECCQFVLLKKCQMQY